MLELLNDPASALSLRDENECSLILDTGASSTILSTKSAEILTKQGFLTALDPTIRKSFRIASGKSVTTSSQATFDVPVLGVITADILEGENVPSLLGAKYLREANAELSFTERGQALRLHGQPVQTEIRGQHIVIAL